MDLTPELQTLIDAAQDAAANAYAPYSRYHVGAAIRSSSGKIFTGVNVENISFGLTVCAERSAISAMATAGESAITAVAVWTRDGNTPCGACRQVLAEFAGERANSIPVICAHSGGVNVYQLSDLLPHGFGDAGLISSD